MSHQELPPIVINGLFSLGAAAVSGVLSWFGGNRQGRVEGETKFINAVQEAAALVIHGLSEQHEECKRDLASLKQQIDDIMAGRVPVYTVTGHKGRRP